MTKDTLWWNQGRDKGNWADMNRAASVGHVFFSFELIVGYLFLCSVFEDHILFESAVEDEITL